MELDRSKAAASLYIQISNILSNDIEKGLYEAGSIIPSEVQLQEQYSVSRMTIRLAISELANKGYVEKMRGIGTVVTYGKIEENLKKVISFSDEMKSHGIIMKTGRCEIKTVLANNTIADKLKVPIQSEVYELIRVRFANNRPMVYSKTYLSLQGLSLDAKEYRDSLYYYLQDKYNVNIIRAIDVLEAVLATDDIANNLEISNGFPTFKRTRTSFNQNDDPIEFSICYYPGDKYKYSINI